MTLTKAHFDRIPDDERLFYFLAGQLRNDINILNKLMLVAMNEVRTAPGQSPRYSAALAQVILLLKLTAGRLYEGHITIKRDFLAKGLLQKYATYMLSEELTQLNDLNRYFGSGNPAIQRIRNKLAFHIDTQPITEAYDSLSSDFKSVEFLSEYSGHNLFHAPETLTLFAMAGDYSEDWPNSLGTVINEITNTCLIMMKFLAAFTNGILSKYIIGTGASLAYVTIEDEPSLDTLRLPFFGPPVEVDLDWDT